MEESNRILNRLRKGKTSFKGKKWESALESFSYVIEAGKELSNYEQKLQLAEAYLERGRTFLARLRTTVDLINAKKDFDAATNVLEGKEAGNPTRKKDEVVILQKAYFSLGVCSTRNCDPSIAMERNEESRKYYSKAIMLAEESGSYDVGSEIIILSHFNRGKVMSRLNRNEEALKDFEIVSSGLEKNPKIRRIERHRLHSYVGLVCLQVKKYQKAFENFRDAKELDPKNREYYDGMAIAKFYLEEYEDSINFFKEAIKMTKKEEIERMSSYYINMGDAKYEQKKYPEALEDFKSACEYSVSKEALQTALYNCGNTYFHLDDLRESGVLDEALNCFNMILNETQDLGEDSFLSKCYNNRALTFMKKAKKVRDGTNNDEYNSYLVKAQNDILMSIQMNPYENRTFLNVLELLQLKQSLNINKVRNLSNSVEYRNTKQLSVDLHPIDVLNLYSTLVMESQYEERIGENDKIIDMCKDYFENRWGSELWFPVMKDVITNETMEKKEISETEAMKEYLKGSTLDDFIVYRCIGGGCYGKAYVCRRKKKHPKFKVLRDLKGLSGIFVLKLLKPDTYIFIGAGMTDYLRKESLMNEKDVSFISYNKNLVNFYTYGSEKKGEISSEFFKVLVKVDERDSLRTGDGTDDPKVSVWEDSHKIAPGGVIGYTTMKCYRKDLRMYIEQRNEQKNVKHGDDGKTDLFITDLEISYILEGIINGAFHLYQNQIVHNDLRENNIFIDPPYGRVGVGDFGCCVFLMKEKEEETEGEDEEKEEETEEEEEKWYIVNENDERLITGGSSSLRSDDVSLNDWKKCKKNGKIAYDVSKKDCLSIGEIGDRILKSRKKQNKDVHTYEKLEDLIKMMTQSEHEKRIELSKARDEIKLIREYLELELKDKPREEMATRRPSTKQSAKPSFKFGKLSSNIQVTSDFSNT